MVVVVGGGRRQLYVDGEGFKDWDLPSTYFFKFSNYFTPMSFSYALKISLSILEFTVA